MRITTMCFTTNTTKRTTISTITLPARGATDASLARAAWDIITRSLEDAEQISQRRPLS